MYRYAAHLEIMVLLHLNFYMKLKNEIIFDVLINILFAAGEIIENLVI